MSETTALVHQPKATVALTVADRCVRCGAQAYVKVETLELGEFLFCMHDWQTKNPTTGKSNKDILEPLAIHVGDETHRLLPQPYDPATDNS